jgi:hypothetical protein
VIVVELTTVKLEAEVVPCLTAVAFEKLVPVIVTVLPKTAELGVFTFELANDVSVGDGTAVEVPETVAEPDVYPVREVPCVIVAVVPGDKPVTVNTRLDPVVEVTATEPLPTVGVAHV